MAHSARSVRSPRSRPARAPAVALAALVALAAACTPRSDDPAAAPPAVAPASPDSAPVDGDEDGPVLVRVERIDAAMLESFPVQVHAHLAGHLSDACVELGEAVVAREGSAFTITLPASRPPDRMCAQALVPFTRTVPLPVRDLPAGTYRIESHGATATFTLDRDNSFNPR